MFWKKTAPPSEEGAARRLYEAVTVRARDPEWYRAGQVADTVDGRFDMVALMLSLLMLRLETAERSDAPAARRLTARLFERFVDDMDASLREIGIGDMAIGKNVGRTMQALGGRLGAYRAALGEGGDLEAALARNLYRGEAPAGPLSWSVARVRAERARLAALGDMDLLQGKA